MNELTVAELSNVFQTLGMTVFILILILVAIRSLNWLLRRQLSHQVGQTDLDLIGLEARVIRSSRPNKIGKVKCQVDNREVILSSASAIPIAIGQRVLITAIDQGVARIRPVGETSPRPPAAPARPS